jgi:PAS domain S-box-containing protein
VDRPSPDSAGALSAPRTSGEESAARRLLPPTGQTAALGRLAELATRLLGAESAQVSLLTDVQTVAGAAGRARSGVGERTALGDSLCTVTARADGPLVVNDARADARVSALLPVGSGTVGAYLGVPLRADSGETVGALCVYDPLPKQWDDDDVIVLEQLAASAVAELELGALALEYERSRARWELAIDAAGIGGFDLDLLTGQLLWDDRLLELFGYDREGFDESLDAFDARVDPADLPHVVQARREAIETLGSYEAEYRVRLPNGRVRWVQARGRVLGDESGRAVRLLGAALDTSDLREGEARFARVLESMSAAFISIDREWVLTYVNAEAERLLGRSRQEIIGKEVWDLLPATIGSVFEETYRRAADTGEPAVLEAYHPAPLDAWYEVRVWPSSDGISLYFLDVTARRAVQAQAERAAARAALLADVTSELTGTLDGEEAAGLLARFVVPTLADWCVVSLIDDEREGASGRRLRNAGWWHADPGMRPAAERFSRLHLNQATEAAFFERVLGSGQRVEVLSAATEAIAAGLEPGEERELVARLAPESLVVLPLRAHDRTLGLLTLFRSAASPPLGDGDLETAVEVAVRAGLALDNARLYARQRALAEGLQRSLLTEPPQPDHGQIVVRYTPAAEAAQVGGDWYDAFLQEGGATVLVIGDVVGHDTAAAAAMGQVRGLLRGIAATTGEGPARVLRRLDEAMELLQVETTATAVALRLEQTPEERQRGVTRVRWSNAGHPPPMAITPDGVVAVLDRVDGGGDLLLGVDRSTTRVESEVTLGRGATVLLYTDGLVERRNESLDEGIARLRATLAEIPGGTLDELCDEILARMLPDAPEDDVALVAVRLHRQDVPRPAEAGPQRVPPSVD